MKIYCNYCGYEVPEGSEFCLHCRNKVARGTSDMNSVAPQTSGFRTAGDLGDPSMQNIPRNNSAPVYNQSVNNSYSGMPMNGGYGYGYGEPTTREYETVNPHGRAVGMGAVENTTFVNNGMPNSYQAPQNGQPYYNNVNPNNPVNTGSKGKPKKMTGMSNMVAYACVILFSTLFLPVWSPCQGLIPDNAVYFIDVLEALSNGGDFTETGCMFFWLAGIFGIVLLISALCKSKVMCIISSAGGTVSLIGWLIYLIDGIDSLLSKSGSSGLEIIFDFEITPIAYGYWFVLIVFGISFISSLSLKND